MRRWLALAIVVGCAGVTVPAPPAITDPTATALATAFVVPGETMEFRVSLRGLSIGLVQVAVGRAGWIEGRPAVILRSRGTSGGLLAVFTQLTWELTTTLDMARALPIENVEDSTLVFNGKTEHDRDADQWSAGDDRHDLHSVAAVLRGWRSRPGERAEVRTKIGGAHIDAVVWEAGREYLASTHSRAVRYDGLALAEYHFSIWVSDDAMRVPLRITAATKWGQIEVQLVEYIPPHD